MANGRKPSPPPGRWALKVSDAVRRELGSRRISLRELGEITGISRSYLSSRLSDKQALSFNDVQIITEALNLPDSYFFDFIDADEGQESENPKSYKGIQLNYASREQAKRLTSKYQCNEEGEIIDPSNYGLAAYRGDPREKEFLREQDEPA